MNKEEVIKKIVSICLGRNGFLFELRAGKFHSQQFRELLSSLEEYREYVRNNDLIDRVVAYCVYMLEIQFTGAQKYPPRNVNEANEINHAAEIYRSIIYEILAPEWMSGSLPDEYNFWRGS